MTRRQSPFWFSCAVLIILAAAAVQVPAATRGPAPEAVSALQTSAPGLGERIPGVFPPLQPQKVTNITAEGVYHFPLQVGNQWVYERKYPIGFGTTWQVDVTRYSDGTAEAAGGAVRGFALEGYFGDVAMVNYSSGGELVEFTPDGTPLLWYRLGTSVGTTWSLGASGSMGPCMDGASAVLASHKELVQVPAGEFTDAVRVNYEPRCMDAGLVSEWFAAGVGLVKRTENSIAGPIESVLLSSRVGGTVLPDHPAATSLTFDRALVVADKDQYSAKLQGTFRVHEQNTDAEEFAFQGCVSASATLVNDWGRPVLETRLGGKGCCECKNLITLVLHGETLALPFGIDLVDENGKPLPEGHYSLNVVLDSLDARAVRPSATTHFHVGAAP